MIYRTMGVSIQPQAIIVDPSPKGSSGRERPFIQARSEPVRVIEIDGEVSRVAEMANSDIERLLVRLIELIGELKKQLLSNVSNVNKTLPAPTPTSTLPQNDLLPDISSKRNGEKPADIKEGFTFPNNGVWGVSSSDTEKMAIIHAAMMRFGQSPTDIFRQVKAQGDGYEVTMRDGFVLHLSKAELTLTAQVNKLTGRDPGMIKDANFIVAAWAKRRQISPFDHVVEPFFYLDTRKRLFDESLVRGFASSKETTMYELGFGGALRNASTTGRDVRSGKSGGSVLTSSTQNSGQRPGTASPDLYLSNREVGKPPEDIWRGFYQDGKGNCGSVAAIKAAMSRFGQSPFGIYESIVPRGAGYDIVMRDGFELHLTYEELKVVHSASVFVGDDMGTFRDAVFLFAASVKREQLESRGASFQECLEELNAGAIPGESLRRLGLAGHMRRATREELRHGAIGVVSEFGHLYATVNGYGDYYGSAKKFPWNPSSRNLSAFKLV